VAPRLFAGAAVTEEKFADAKRPEVFPRCLTQKFWRAAIAGAGGNAARPGPCLEDGSCLTSQVLQTVETMQARHQGAGNGLAFLTQLDAAPVTGIEASHLHRQGFDALVGFRGQTPVFRRREQGRRPAGRGKKAVVLAGKSAQRHFLALVIGADENAEHLAAAGNKESVSTQVGRRRTIGKRPLLFQSVDQSPGMNQAITPAEPVPTAAAPAPATGGATVFFVHDSATQETPPEANRPVAAVVAYSHLGHGDEIEAETVAELPQTLAIGAGFAPGHRRGRR